MTTFFGWWLVLILYMAALNRLGCIAARITDNDFEWRLMFYPCALGLSLMVIGASA